MCESNTLVSICLNHLKCPVIALHGAPYLSCMAHHDSKIQRRVRRTTSSISLWDSLARLHSVYIPKSWNYTLRLVNISRWGIRATDATAKLPSWLLVAVAVGAVQSSPAIVNLMHWNWPLPIGCRLWSLMYVSAAITSEEPAIVLSTAETSSSRYIWVQILGTLLLCICKMLTMLPFVQEYFHSCVLGCRSLQVLLDALECSACIAHQ